MQINRTKRPASSGKIDFTIPSIHQSKLTNGLETYFSEKNDLPLVRLNLLVNSGSKYDSINCKGLSNLLTMCIDEGAGQYNALQLADEFEMLGAQFSISSDRDMNVFSLQVLSENYKPALKLLGSIITTPHLKENDFKRERNKVLVRMEQAKLEPDYIAEVCFEYLLFGREAAYAYPIIGIRDNVQSINLESIKDFYQRQFSPLNSAIALVGNIGFESLKSDLTDVFENWSSGSPIEGPVINLNRKQSKVFLINKPDSVQTEIRTGHLSSKRSEKDFFQKQIINLVLGGQFSSRLNLNLREKHGYTYGVHSRFSYLKEAGYFAVSTSVDLENTLNALRQIYSEIKKIKEGLTSEELAFAKSSLIKRFPANFETYGQITGNISSKIIYNLPNDYFENYLNKLNAVSLEEVNQTSLSSIQSETLTTVMVGDSKKILKQINKDEFGEIITVEFDDVFNLP